MRELSDSELDAISAATGPGFCRRLTWWESVKVEYVGLFFGEDVARGVARKYSYSS